MDPVTQGALGATVAQLSLPFETQRPHRIWLAGALAGAAADLDVLIRSSSNPLLSLHFHRHFTHSLFFIPIGAFLVALGLWFIPYFNKTWKITFIACLFGYATHGILDATTSYGTVLFWPFSETRVHWDLIFIINPMFTVPLVCGLSAGLVFHRRHYIGVGLALSLLFLLANSLQHQRALQFFNSYLQRNYPMADKIRVLPRSLSSIAWQGLARFNDTIFVSDIVAPWLHPPYQQSNQQFPAFKTKNTPDYIQNSLSLRYDLRIFRWFTDDYLILMDENPLTLADGRFLVGKNPRRALWAMQFTPSLKHAKKLRLTTVRPLP